MEFVRIDRENWARKETFEHYFSAVPCTYSMTVRLDITALRQRGHRLYPALLHALTAIVNRHPEFRTDLGPDGEPGVYSEMHPCYTVFHPEDETFSNLWTAYDPDLDRFCAAYEQDLRLYGQRRGFTGKPGCPPNSFTVSMIPWATFEGFNLNLQDSYRYLLPIFTLGKYREENVRTWPCRCTTLSATATTPAALPKNCRHGSGRKRRGLFVSGRAPGGTCHPLPARL